jgi:hypothetical protein
MISVGQIRHADEVRFTKACRERLVESDSPGFVEDEISRREAAPSECTLRMGTTCQRRKRPTLAKTRFVKLFEVDADRPLGAKSVDRQTSAENCHIKATVKGV